MINARVSPIADMQRIGETLPEILLKPRYVFFKLNEPAVMGKPTVNPTEDYPHFAPGTGWQFLGEIALSVDSGADVRIKRWLIKILAPLNLNANFLHKIIQSAQDAQIHAQKSDNISVAHKTVYLAVFAQSRQAVGLQTWGFFRIEKGENTAKNSQNSAHRIELYLYLEGS